MSMLRKHEQLWLLWALCLACVWAPVNVLLPGSWWGLPICALASLGVSCVVLWLIP